VRSSGLRERSVGRIASQHQLRPLTDSSPERAQVVRKLNDAGIATIAWMALPKLVGVYNLEGCIHQGFLPKLQDLSREHPVRLSATNVAKAREFRAGVQTTLWVASRIVYIGMAWLLVIAWFVAWLRNRLKPRPADVRQIGRPTVKRLSCGMGCVRGPDRPGQ